MKYPLMILCSSAVALAALVSSVADAETRYRLQDLGDLTGPTVEGAAMPNGINDKGEVVGWSFDDLGNSRGFLWRRGQMIDLGELAPRGGASAESVNNHSVVVGLASIPEVGGFGFRWEKGVMTDIGSLPNSHANPNDINNRGQIVGDSPCTRSAPTCDILGRPTQAFLYERGVIMSLGSLPGGSSETRARAINDHGEIVGSTQTVNGGRAFLWREGVMTDLGLPAESPVNPITGTAAFDINNRGQVVGAASDGRVARAFLWQKGRMTVLPALDANSFFTTAAAINERQQIVGVSSTLLPRPNSVAVIWQHGVPAQLRMRADDPSAGYVTLQAAKGINERGQIIAWGFDSRLGGGARAYLLTPVRIRSAWNRGSTPTQH